MATTIVYGPRGCGKTTNALALMRKYRCRRVVDDWLPGRGPGYTVVPDNALLLTENHPQHTIFPVVSYEEAMKGVIPERRQ